MKANELRIGNLVYETINRSNEKVVEISSLSDGHIAWRPGRNTGHHAHIKPIPLTEEWLEKFGFDDDNKRGVFRWIVNPRIKGYYFFLHDRHIKTLEYVHQLQNLYFALIGEELTISS